MYHVGVEDVKYSPYADGNSVPFPLLDDSSREISKLWGMFDPYQRSSTGQRMAARNVYFLKGLKLMAMIALPSTTGRNIDEILRIIDSLQLSDAHPELATPADWQIGDDVMLQNSAKGKSDTIHVPLPSGKDYMRLTADPSDKKKNKNSGSQALMKGITHTLSFLAGTIVVVLASTTKSQTSAPKSSRRAEDHGMR